MFCQQVTLLQLWQIIILLVSSVDGSSELQELQQSAPRAGYLYGYHYHHTLALGGFLGLVLIKITAIVVVLATLITGGLLIKLFGLGLVFGSTRLPYYYNQPFPPPYNANYYRAIVQPRLDIVKTIFTLMEVDTETCKTALVCLLDKEAAQSPLLDSAFKFIMDSVWKVEIGRENLEDCTDLYLKCNNLIEEN